jgi:hypothetical protein
MVRGVKVRPAISSCCKGTARQSRARWSSIPFDTDGGYIRESQHPGAPCGLFMGADQHIWLAHGHTGQIMKLDLDGKVAGWSPEGDPARQQANTARHYIAVSPRDEIFVADTLNWRVQNM